MKVKLYKQKLANSEKCVSDLPPVSCWWLYQETEINLGFLLIDYFWEHWTLSCLVITCS